MSKKDKWEAGFAYQDKKDPVFYHADVICNGTVRVAKSSGVGKEQAEAYAQLIAAAPELLEACKDARRVVRCDPLLTATLGILDDAIAKAKL